MPHGSVLAPLLFNVALQPVLWELSNTPDVRLLMYAGDGMASSTHRSLEHREWGEQVTLDTTLAWCTSLGLSTENTSYISIANSWSRRKLDQAPVRLKLGGRVVAEVTTVRVF